MAITETRQYLAFGLSEEVFALDISHVREILEYTTVTKVPQTPSFMKGVINLRGSVVPVIDMGLKLGLPETNRTIDTCIIVMEVSLDEEKAVMGAMVDSVQEVFEMEPGQIEGAPRLGTHLNMEFIKGIGKKDDRFCIILDIDRVFSAQELAAIEGQDIASCA